MSSKAYPFVGLGSSLRPLMNLGLPSFFSLLQAQVFFIIIIFFYGVQLSVPFWVLVQHYDILNLNRVSEQEYACAYIDHAYATQLYVYVYYEYLYAHAYIPKILNPEN